MLRFSGVSGQRYVLFGLDWVYKLFFFKIESSYSQSLSPDLIPFKNLEDRDTVGLFLP